MQKKDTQEQKYKKRNEFKFNIICNEKGEELESIIERAFGNYCMEKLK